MKTSKSLQLLDTQNNNISPIVGIESLFYETYVSNNNVNTIHRNSLYDKLLMDVSSYKLNYQSDGTLSGGDATTVIMNLETKSVKNDKISGSGTKIVPDTKGLKYSYATVNDFASFIGKNSSLATALVSNATFANSLTYTESTIQNKVAHTLNLGKLTIGKKVTDISIYYPKINYSAGNLIINYPYNTTKDDVYCQILPTWGEDDPRNGYVLKIDTLQSDSEPYYLNWDKANNHLHELSQMPGYISGYKTLLFSDTSLNQGTNVKYNLIVSNNNYKSGNAVTPLSSLTNIVTNITAESNELTITKYSLTAGNTETSLIDIDSVNHANYAEYANTVNLSSIISNWSLYESGQYLTKDGDKLKFDKPTTSSTPASYTYNGAQSLRNLKEENSPDTFSTGTFLYTKNDSNNVYVVDAVQKLYNRTTAGDELDGSIHFINIPQTAWGLSLLKSADTSIKFTKGDATTITADTSIITNLSFRRSSAPSNTEYFDEIVYQTGTLPDSIINGSGKVGNNTSTGTIYLVGTTTKGTTTDLSYIPKYAIKISKQTASNPLIDLGVDISNDPQGNGIALVYANSYYASSDETLKKNIERIEDSDVIPDIYAFDWADNNQHSYGFIAQRLEEQGYPELVSESRIKSVNYNAALALTVGKLKAKVEKQDAIIAALQKEIQNIKMIIQSK